ncbi:hypothetical protein EVAR_97053_1 [Eumeta japonica]|uniref:Uncharacterized protein n=1 Tax=Eumeta variegata TaxID=151549 RepID=A0A4C1WNS8_EUMVA|nr:hypothetical protein EVAR_97053_1 [Eumeta japonica]
MYEKKLRYEKPEYKINNNPKELVVGIIDIENISFEYPIGDAFSDDNDYFLKNGMKGRRVSILEAEPKSGYVDRDEIEHAGWIGTMMGITVSVNTKDVVNHSMSIWAKM